MPLFPLNIPSENGFFLRVKCHIFGPWDERKNYIYFAIWKCYVKIGNFRNFISTSKSPILRPYGDIAKGRMGAQVRGRAGWGYSPSLPPYGREKQVGGVGSRKGGVVCEGTINQPEQNSRIWEAALIG